MHIKVYLYALGLVLVTNVSPIFIKLLFLYLMAVHYTKPIHCLTQPFAVSLYTVISVGEHGMLHQRELEEMFHRLVCLLALARCIMLL